MKAHHLLFAAVVAGITFPALAEEPALQPGKAHLPIAPAPPAPAAPPAPPAPASFSAPPAPPAAPAAPLPPIDSRSGAGMIAFLGGGAVVKNKPYSAEIVSERVQQLADGNQIVNKSSSMSYRDSAGRTRTEVRDELGVIKTVTIYDPVQQEHWNLDPKRKTATRFSLSAEAARASAGIARAEAELARQSARIAVAQARLTAQQERDVARSAAEGARLSARQERDIARAAAAEARREVDRLRREGKLPEHTQVIIKDVQHGNEQKEVRIRMVPPAPPAPPAPPSMRALAAPPAPPALPAPAAPPAPPAPPPPPPQLAGLAAQIGPMIAGASSDAKWSGKASTRDLGTRNFFGVAARGSQRSYDIPAGAIGNRQPIAVSNETWTAPDLDIVVYHKRSDPRSGALVYQLARLQRAEPAAALFRVPLDYTVRDPMRTINRKVTGRVPADKD